MKEHTIHSIGETTTKHYAEFKAFLRHPETKTDEGLAWWRKSHWSALIGLMLLIAAMVVRRHPRDREPGLMFALLGPLLSIVTSLFGGVSGGVLAVLESLGAASLGIRFYAGLTVGLIITNNAVRDVAIDLGKAVIGAVL